MKKHILTLSLLACSCILFAQNENPFSQFGYEAPVMQVKEQSAMDNDTLFIVENQNPNSDIKWLVIDAKNQLIRLYSAEGIEVGNENLQVYMASVISISFLFFKTIMVSEAGNYAEITGYKLGYWLWVISSLVISFGGLWILLKNSPAKKQRL